MRLCAESRKYAGTYTSKDTHTKPWTHSHTDTSQNGFPHRALFAAAKSTPARWAESPGRGGATSLFRRRPCPGQHGGRSDGGGMGAPILERDIPRRARVVRSGSERASERASGGRGRAEGGRRVRVHFKARMARLPGAGAENRGTRRKVGKGREGRRPLPCLLSSLPRGMAEPAGRCR